MCFSAPVFRSRPPCSSFQTMAFAKSSASFVPRYCCGKKVLLRQKGILHQESGDARGEAWVMSAGGTAMVYVTNPERKASLISQLRDLFAGAEGIDGTYGVEEFSKLGLPLPATSDQAPDLVLAAKPGYVFDNKSDGEYITEPAEGGTHGYLNTDPQMQAIFIAWGVDVPKGARLGTVSNLDVAPTVAALLGLTMTETKGKPIEQIVNHTIAH